MTKELEVRVMRIQTSTPAPTEPEEQQEKTDKLVRRWNQNPHHLLTIGIVGTIV